MGDAPKLVAHARQPRALPADRGASDRAARVRGRARHPNDHPDPLVRDPGASRRRHDLRRQPGAQDDLRRLPVRLRARGDGKALPVRGPRRSRATASPGPLDDAADLHGRGQQHDGERSRPAGVRPDRPALRRHALRRRRSRLRGERRVGLGEASDEHDPVVRYCGESYDGIVLVGGFSKSYSSLAAFVACPTELKELLKTAAPPYLYSGPSPIASLATVLAGFDVNEARGDAIRADLWRKTDQVLQSLDRLGVHTPNRSGFPIIEVPLARHEDIDAAGRFLFEHGVYVTLAAYPLVPKSEVGFRIQVTAANSEAEIEQLVDTLGKLANTFDLPPARQEYAA